jgi:hypothetical protein
MFTCSTQIYYLFVYNRLITGYIEATMNYYNAISSYNGAVLSQWTDDGPQEEMKEIISEASYQHDGESDDLSAVTEVQAYFEQFRSNLRNGILYDSGPPLKQGQVLGDIDGTHLKVTGKLSVRSLLTQFECTARPVATCAYCMQVCVCACSASSLCGAILAYICCELCLYSLHRYV